MFFLIIAGQNMELIYLGFYSQLHRKKCQGHFYSFNSNRLIFQNLKSSEYTDITYIYLSYKVGTYIIINHIS